MSDCCASDCESKPRLKKRDCYVCKQSCLNVELKTLLHHVQNPWLYQFTDEAYYFCSNPDCDVVYFNDENSIIKKQEVRTRIGIKEQSDDALICYCFGVSRAQAHENEQAKAFVVKQTKESVCSCDTANPAGRCCLKDFAKL